MSEYKPCPCKHGDYIRPNEIGEKEVYCELTARWMNVTLGDCLGNCENEDTDEFYAAVIRAFGGADRE